MKAVDQIQPLPESTWRDNERKFEALCRLVEYGQGSFTLALIDIDLPSKRQKTLDDLRKKFTDLNLITVELSPLPPDVPKTYNVLDQLGERVNYLSPDKPPDALIITGLETLFPKALASDETRITEEIREALQPLNLGRNIFARLFPCPVILCLPPRAMGILVRSAPDIVSWKSAAFSFKSDLDTVRQEIAQAASVKTNWWTRLRARRMDREVLRKEAKQLEALLADAHELPADNETIARLNLRLGWVAVALDNRLRALAAFDEAIKHTQEPSLKKVATQGQKAAKRIKLSIAVAPERAADLRKLFRGATSLTEADGLYGREDELQRLVSQVTSVSTRFLTVWGETGCGKSSLARAGLVPVLKQQNHFLPVVVRQWNEPLQNIRRALEQAAPDIDLSDLTTLLGCVQRIAARTEKTVVLVCDQFEQFFTSHPLLSERKAVIKEIGACDNDFRVPCKFVFVIRTDELGRMAEFDSEVPEPLEQRKRFYLPLFSAEDAARVLRKLSYKAALDWSDDLLASVVKDLSNNGRVSPLDLQLVGTSLAISGIDNQMDYAKADRSDGLRENYLRFILRNLRTSRYNERVMKRILRAFISKDWVGHTRSLDELTKLTGYKKTRLARQLSLMIEAHLIQQETAPDNQSSAPHYILPHYDIYEMVLALKFPVESKRQHANRLVRQVRENLRERSQLSLGLRAAWLVRKHADLRKLGNAEDRTKVQAILRRSLGWGIIKWIAIPLLLLMSILYVVQNSFEYVTAEHDFATRVVVRRGLPWLGFLPWLGNDIVLDTGLDEIDSLPELTIHRDWGKPASEILTNPEFVSHLSVVEKGKLLCQVGDVDRGIESLFAVLNTALDDDSWSASPALGVLRQVANVDPVRAPQIRSRLTAIGMDLSIEETEPTVLLPKDKKAQSRYDEIKNLTQKALKSPANISQPAEIFLKLTESLNDNDSDVRSAAADGIKEIVKTTPKASARLLRNLNNDINGDRPTARRDAILALRQIAQVNEEAKERLFELLIGGNDDDLYYVSSEVSDAAPALFVVEAETLAKSDLDPLQFLFAHLEGRQSYLPQGNANTYAVYRNLLVTAMAKWLVSDKPEAKNTQAALRQRLEQMRASDKRLHLRIAAWNALAEAAELASKGKSD